MVDITETYQEEEIIPYQELIKNKTVDMVMTAHIINKKIDPNYPATLSPFFIKEILRKQLNFKGVVVSDDMQMGAITENFGFEEALIRAINAGCDLLIISNNGNIYDETASYQARDIIFNAVKEGKIPIERIIESSDRIYTLKSKFGVI
jgi:beta-N-acetylhexosaminidase